jgi:hypothetical protein
MEIGVGSSFYQNGWKRYRKRFSKYLNCMFADFSRYDQNIIEELMVIAFGCARACYPKSEEIDNTFLYMMSGFIHKQVAIPGRFVYMISKGLPSGSPFTSLINSICAWLIWSYVFKLVNIKNVDLMVYGDDTIAGIPGIQEFPENITDIIKTELGVTVDPFEISTFTSSEDQHLNANFLKTYDYFGFPGRTKEDVMELLMYPKKYSVNKWDNSFKITGTLYTGPGNPLSIDILCEFRDWLRNTFMAKEKVYPFKNQRGNIAKRISMRTAIINYYKTPIPCIGDKNNNMLWWLEKESYANYSGANWLQRIYSSKYDIDLLQLACS